MKLQIRKYRKLPKEVLAVKISTNNINEVAAWCGGSVKGIKLPVDQQVIDIETKKGEMRASMGDWVIKGIEGEFYPCKPTIFVNSYESVED